MIPETVGKTLDMTKIGDEFQFPIADWHDATVQAAVGNQDSGWQSGVVTLQITNDGSNWEALGSGVTFSADGLAGPFDLRWNKMRAVVTTISSGAAKVKVTVKGRKWAYGREGAR